MEGQLKENEPHPAAEGARQWLIGYIQRKDAYALLRLQESFAICALEGNRLAEICSETLRRLLNKEPVSDRYLLGLVWTIRDMEEKEKRSLQPVTEAEALEAVMAYGHETGRPVGTGLMVKNVIRALVAHAGGRPLELPCDKEKGLL